MDFFAPPGLGNGGLRRLQHQRQKYQWDCGLACVLMILPQENRKFFLQNFNQVCSQEGFDKSTWTIDLAYLLKRFELDSLFYTTTLGIQPAYNGQPFYAKVIQKDEARVLKRFKGADGAGVRVEKKSITLAELLSHVQNHGPAIILTNGSLLQCEICKINKLSSELRACLPWRPSYSGHFVVVCGFDWQRQLIFYHNPSYTERVCAITFSAFDEARFCYGTDEDILLTFTNHLEFMQDASPFLTST